MRILPTVVRVASPILSGVLMFAGTAAYAQDAGSQWIDLGQDQVIELVSVAPGTFVQGSPANEVGRGTDETQREVTLTKPFFLGKTPVTRGQFARFAAETGYRTEAEKGTSGGYGWDGAKLVQKKEFTWKNPGFPQTDEHSVTLVTFNDARAFLAWLSRKSGRTFALPTEAQWEYACRAGSTTAFPNGADPAQLGTVAWFRGNSGDGTRPVGQKALNTWGLADMLGNVWEWCDDWYAPYPSDPATDPRQTQSNLSDKPRRVLRGGSWLKDAAACRSAARYRNDPASRNADNGFRVMTFDAAARVVAPPSTPQTNAVPGALNVEAERVPAAAPATHESHGEHQRSSPSRPPSRGTSLFGLLFPVVVVAGLGLLVVRLLRRLMSQGGTGVVPAAPGRMSESSPRGPIRTRIVEDGFWIESAELPDGAVLDCRYTAEGQQRQESVTFRSGGSGQFVFTGSRPTSVAVSVVPGSVPPPLSQRAAATYLGSQLGDDEPREEDNPRRFRGHPPAY